jgi:hypothetical protein
MAKFMILYRATTSVRDQMANATPEQRKAGMDAWMVWAGKAGDAVVDLGTPLAPTTHVGAAAAGGEDVCGYSILQAASAQDITNLLDGHPHLEMPGSSIDVLEMLSMPGM